MNANEKDENGWTLLHWVAYYNRFEMAEFLLDLDADANINNFLGLCPLQLIDDPNLPLFKLLALNTNRYITERKLQECLEHQPDRLRMLKAINCIENGDYTGLIRLLNSGLNINEQDFEGFTLLHYATICKQEKIAAYLLKKGADTEITNKFDLIPIQFVEDKTSTLFSLFLNYMKDKKVLKRLFGNQNTDTVRVVTESDLPIEIRLKQQNSKKRKQVAVLKH